MAGRADRGDRGRSRPDRLRRAVGPVPQPAPGRGDAGPAAPDHPPVPAGRAGPALPVRPAGRRSPADSRPAALTAEDRKTITRQIADTQTVTIPAGYASRDFVTDPASGWAVLDRPAVLVCADPVETVRELLGVLEQLIMSRTPLVVVAPSLAPEVLATLEVNQIQQTMQLLAVTPDASRAVRHRHRLRRDDHGPRRPSVRVRAARPARPLRALGEHGQGQPRDHVGRGAAERVIAYRVPRKEGLFALGGAQTRTSRRSPQSRYDPVSLLRRPCDART